MSEDQLLKLLQILFWSTSLILVICGLIVTIVGWRVNSQNAKNLAMKKDTHETIDRTLKAIVELEDAALSFWLEPDSKIRAYQLISFHRRTINALKQLLELKGGKMPSSDIISLRKACTLDAESAARPIQEDDERVRRISLITSRITSSELLEKSWKEK